MNDSEINLIRDLSFKRITKADFLKSVPVNIMLNKEYLRNLLESAYNNKNADDVYYILNLISIFELFDQNYVGILCNWHYKHEDIARRLQLLKSPDSIKALYQSAIAKFDYLEHDNSYSLVRKCIFALGDINTDKSIEKLKLLAQLGDEEISSYVEEQFEREKIKTKL